MPVAIPVIQANAVLRLREFGNFLRTSVFPTASISLWREELQGVASDLATLNRTTETDFLAVGGNLMSFLSASRQLHSDIGGLTALVSGEQTRHAGEALVSVRGYVQEMRLRSEESGRSLLTLQASATRIHREFSTFGKIALSFQITAILARIETAHLTLSQQDLKNLADEVLACSSGIQSRADQVLEAASAFDSRIAATLLEVSRFEAVQLKELPTLLAAVDADMGIIEARQRGAASASSKLAADLHSVTRDLGAIATSIQFHDITRQQVEHVAEALTDLLQNAPRGPFPASDTLLVQLQKAQLASATVAFAESTSKIDLDLNGIARRVADMATSSKSILGVDANEGSSFLNEMQSRFAAILRAVSELNTLERSTRNIVTDLDGISQTLRSSVQEVQVIEVQLSRIAINAAISACHIGIDGEPLNVVAGAMQALQAECAARSAEAGEALDAISEAIAALAGSHAGGDAGETGESAGTALLDDLKNRMADLHSAGESGEAAASTIAALANTLCEDLQKARDHSGIGQVFAATVKRCSEVLDTVIAHAGPANSMAATQSAPERRYTMQAERDVHMAMAGGTLLALEVPLEAAADSSGDVEFF